MTVPSTENITDLLDEVPPTMTSDHFTHPKVGSYGPKLKTKRHTDRHTGVNHTENKGVSIYSDNCNG